MIGSSSTCVKPMPAQYGASRSASASQPCAPSTAAGSQEAACTSYMDMGAFGFCRAARCCIHAASVQRHAAALATMHLGYGVGFWTELGRRLVDRRRA